jgi:endonuclease/exonuclease/phosphatase family metal-dependent hydrolase
MWMDLAVLSRFALAPGLRTALSPLREPWLRQQFNLRRALVTTEVPVEGGPPLAVGVTHLSAFSRGDGTLPRQVETLAAWMRARRAAGQSFVLGGDLNLLPPGDDPARLGADAAEYADQPNPADALLAAFRSVVPAERLLLPESRTYIPPGAMVPDRVLDYVFVSDDIEVIAAGPLPVDPMVSDHLPLRAELRLG